MNSSNTVKIKLSCGEGFLAGAKRLEKVLRFTISEDGFPVEVVEGQQNGVKKQGAVGYIYYNREHMFYRELGVLIEGLRRGGDFEEYDDGHFKMVGVMIDASRCAVPTVETLKRQLDYLAVMGYNLAMLYTEDTVELKDYPYFGYMRGRYTRRQIMEVDDYAFGYGIELVPCIECYGHMEKYLIWDEAAPLKDTPNVLMAREEKTFDFLDKLISFVSSSVRSRRIHVGMDEAWNMGRGKFLDKHGYVPPFSIFNEYMERLVAITDKYGLKPMMWSDMYFRISSKKHAYYSFDEGLSEEALNNIPPQMDLVYWHYGERAGCDDHMLEVHKNTGRKIVFAGGLWSWSGHFPEIEYTRITTDAALAACRRHGVDEAMTTLWLNDNAECEINSCLIGLSYFAERVYRQDSAEADFVSRFESVTDGSHEAFNTLGLYHNYFRGETFKSFSYRFVGKSVFWQDIMEGLYDYTLFERPMSRHYYTQAKRMKAFAKKESREGKWFYLYDYGAAVFEYMAVKCEIAEKLVPSYKAGDKDTLREIAEVLLPRLQRRTKALHKKHKEIWFNTHKIIGWANMDVRYAGVVARCDTAIQLITRYLNGEDSAIEELEEERLYKPVSGFGPYSSIVTPNLKI